MGDYIALLKPRVMSLVIFTALVGLMIAPVHVHPVLAFTSILCIAVGAGASGALNMAYESDVDALMTRTANRPIPRGRITQAEAARRYEQALDKDLPTHLASVISQHLARIRSDRDRLATVKQGSKQAS